MKHFVSCLNCDTTKIGTSRDPPFYIPIIFKDNKDKMCEIFAIQALLITLSISTTNYLIYNLTHKKHY